MTSQREKRTKIFVSYSHEDKRWLDLLRVHLDPLEREYGLITWDDSRIRPGLKWEDEIRSALDLAGVAVLLISPNFFSSRYIMASELPRLLKAAQDGGTLILPLIISPSRYRKSELSQFQAVNDPEKPLAGMSKVDRDSVLNQLSNRIEEWLTGLRGSDLADERIKRKVSPKEVIPLQERPDETDTRAPYQVYGVHRLAEETQPESKSSWKLWIGIALIAVLGIGIVGIELLQGGESPHNGPPPAETNSNAGTNSNEVRVKLKWGDMGTPLGDDLVIELNDTQYDKSSNSYKVNAVIRTPGYKEYGLPNQPVGNIFFIEGKSKYSVKVEAADKDSAEFLVKLETN
jgi:hypothetical protein